MSMRYTDSAGVVRTIVAICTTDHDRAVVVGDPTDDDTHDRATFVPVAYILPSGSPSGLAEWWLIDRKCLRIVDCGTIPQPPAEPRPADERGDRFDVEREWLGRPVTFTVLVTSWGFPGSYGADGGEPPEGPEAEVIAARFDTGEELPAVPAEVGLGPMWESLCEEVIQAAIDKGPPEPDYAGSDD